MTSLNIKSPELREKILSHRIISAILATIGTALLLMPVIVGFMTKFTSTGGSDDALYLFVRGIFGISIIASAAAFSVYKNLTLTAIPCVFGILTAIFPMIDNIVSFTGAIKRANMFSMNVDYSSYLIIIGEYLAFMLLGLLTLLFVLGKFRHSTIILIISVVSCLASAFTAIDRYVTYYIPLYEVMCFAYASVISAIPIFLVFATVPAQKKEKYKARRMR